MNTDREKLHIAVDNFMDFAEKHASKGCSIVGVIDPRCPSGLYQFLLHEDKTTGELYIPKHIQTKHGFRTEKTQGGIFYHDL